MTNFEYREDQLRAVAKIRKGFDSVDNLILNGPTGCGKSGISYLTHLKHTEDFPNYRTTILCNQKILQDQYADFLDDQKGVMVLKGKNNYLCAADDKTPVDEAPCSLGVKCNLQSECEYFVRKSQMGTVPVLITNYHQMLSFLDSPQGFTRESDLIVYDESHNLSEIFTDYYKLSITTLDIPYYDKMYKDLDGSGFGHIVELLDDIMSNLSLLRIDTPAKVLDDLVKLRQCLLTDLTVAIKNVQDKVILRIFGNLYTKESNFLVKAENWIRYRDVVRFVPDLQKNGEVVTYTLTPLKVDGVVEPILKSLSSKRIFMSATLFPRLFMKHVGLKDDYINIQLPMVVPASSRQIVFCPVANFNRENMKPGAHEFDSLIANISSLLELHAKEEDSGVIYTPSYALASLLRENLMQTTKRLGYKIITNADAGGREQAIDEFRDTSVKKRLLISPSFTEGINFEDDISRFQMMVKTPFRSIGDAYVKEKMNMDKEWYEIDTVIRLIQFSGRSCRHAKDFCITYIFDRNMLRLYEKYKEDVPKWFRDAVVYTK